MTQEVRETEAPLAGSDEPHDSLTLPLPDQAPQQNFDHPPSSINTLLAEQWSRRRRLRRIGATALAGSLAFVLTIGARSCEPIQTTWDQYASNNQATTIVE